ncbi:MAG: glycoside hydrolase family 3 protein, partial [Anaerolineae bacterium]|nr:glycoside hydrolase family 3 protein [Anaerolineae bacterium]
MLKRFSLLFLSLVFWIALGLMPVVAQEDAPYKDASLNAEERADDLLARMTIDEKIGQLTLVEKNSINPDDITDLFLGGLLSGGGGSPARNTPEGWAEMVDGYQELALATRLGIPMIYGADGVHGHNNLRGAVIFPHNIGLGATRNPELVEKTCNFTAKEMMATGIYWNYAPVVAVPQDIRWGRIYEGFSEDTGLVSELAVACLKGMQSGSPYVVATPKHFVGDGGTVWGSATTGDYQIDQGVTDVDEATLRAIHLPPYKAAIDAGAQTIMVSFSSWGGMKMSAQKYLITDVLKGELGFTGFVVSDWGGIDQISGDYYADNVTSFNAGMDMNMVPYDYNRFIDVMYKAVESGDIPMERIDDAVRRILLVKFQMGLFEHPFSQPDLLAQVGSDEHREV